MRYKDASVLDKTQTYEIRTDEFVPVLRSKLLCFKYPQPNYRDEALPIAPITVAAVENVLATKLDEIVSALPEIDANMVSLYPEGYLKSMVLNVTTGEVPENESWMPIRHLNQLFINAHTLPVALLVVGAVRLLRRQTTGKEQAAYELINYQLYYAATHYLAKRVIVDDNDLLLLAEVAGYDEQLNRHEVFWLDQDQYLAFVAEGITEQQIISFIVTERRSPNIEEIKSINSPMTLISVE